MVAMIKSLKRGITSYSNKPEEERYTEWIIMVALFLFVGSNESNDNLLEIEKYFKKEFVNGTPYFIFKAKKQ